jgi:hypothetical protein
MLRIIVITQVLFICHPGENRDPEMYLYWIPAFAGMTRIKNIEEPE